MLFLFNPDLKSFKICFLLSNSNFFREKMKLKIEFSFEQKLDPPQFENIRKSVFMGPILKNLKIALKTFKFSQPGIKMLLCDLMGLFLLQDFP